MGQSLYTVISVKKKKKVEQGMHVEIAWVCLISGALEHRCCSQVSRTWLGILEAAAGRPQCESLVKRLLRIWTD